MIQWRATTDLDGAVHVSLVIERSDLTSMHRDRLALLQSAGENIERVIENPQEPTREGSLERAVLQSLRSAGRKLCSTPGCDGIKIKTGDCFTCPECGH